MQTSSPLAALQPQQPVFGAARWNLTVDRPASNPRSDPQCGQSFNFKDLSMHNARPAGSKDYFSLKPAHRTSSPAANLAIDMHQNLSIDRSPRFPTPRRTLFIQTTSINALSPDGMEVTESIGIGTGLADLRMKDLMHTPPASASPSLDIDMETSPLPHKPAFVSSQVSVQSPTPESTPVIEEDNMMASPMELVPSVVESVRVERKRPLPMPITRPSLKYKALSSSQVPMSAGLTGQRPPLFNFGNSQRPLGYKPPSLEELEEAFGDSPGKDVSGKTSAPASTSTTTTTTPLVAPRPRSANQITRNLGSPWNGSPAGRLFPRPGAPAPLAKRRKGYRRANSVFDGSDRFAKSFLQGSMSSIPEFDSAQDRKLPSFLNDASDERIRRITMNTLVDVLDGKYAEHYDDVKIVDCRFEYEYEGGHIDGALNCTDKAAFASSFFPAPSNSARTLIVFHCEYSAQRAPMTAHFFRDTDRGMNEQSQSPLSYPEIYILDGGYSAFFKVHKCRCFPQSYVEMHDKNHIEACERGMDRINLKQRRKLSRAHTFALGEREHRIQESPTAPSRGTSCQTTASISMDICPGNRSTPSLPTLGTLPVPHRSPLTMRSISY